MLTKFEHQQYWELPLSGILVMLGAHAEYKTCRQRVWVGVPREGRPVGETVQLTVAAAPTWNTVLQKAPGNKIISPQAGVQKAQPRGKK